MIRNIITICLIILALVIYQIFVKMVYIYISPELMSPILHCAKIFNKGEWLYIQGNPTYQTEDFCVMKFEAKCSVEDGKKCSLNSDSKPTSTYYNTPWVNISRQLARLKCGAIGTDFSLINENQFLTIIEDIKTTFKYQNMKLDSSISFLNTGHTDNNPPHSCESSIDDSYNYVEKNCMGLETKSINQRQKRTYELSTGGVIWDLSGNVWELTADSLNPRGGSWSSLSSVNSLFLTLETKSIRVGSDKIGFRCVKLVPKKP